MRQFAKDWINQLIMPSPIVKQLGARLISLSGETAHIRVPFPKGGSSLPSHADSSAIAAIVDMAGTVAAIAGIERDNIGACSTSQISITFLAIAHSAFVDARTAIVHRTPEQVIVDVSVTTDQEAVLAKATVTLRMFEYETGADTERCVKRPIPDLQ